MAVCVITVKWHRGYDFEKSLDCETVYRAYVTRTVVGAVEKIVKLG